MMADSRTFKEMTKKKSMNIAIVIHSIAMDNADSRHNPPASTPYCAAAAVPNIMTINHAILRPNERLSILNNPIKKNKQPMAIPDIDL
jgi:hypothetical protein